MMSQMHARHKPLFFFSGFMHLSLCPVLPLGATGVSGRTECLFFYNFMNGRGVQKSWKGYTKIRRAEWNRMSFSKNCEKKGVGGLHSRPHTPFLFRTQCPRWPSTFTLPRLMLEFWLSVLESVRSLKRNTIFLLLICFHAQAFKFQNITLDFPRNKTWISLL